MLRIFTFVTHTQVILFHLLSSCTKTYTVVTGWLQLGSQKIITLSKAKYLAQPWIQEHWKDSWFFLSICLNCIFPLRNDFSYHPYLIHKGKSSGQLGSFQQFSWSGSLSALQLAFLRFKSGCQNFHWVIELPLKEPLSLATVSQQHPPLGLQLLQLKDCEAICYKVTATLTLSCSSRCIYELSHSAAALSSKDGTVKAGIKLRKSSTVT